MKASKWVKDSKIARKLYKDQIIGEKPGYIEVEYDDPNVLTMETIQNAYNKLIKMAGQTPTKIFISTKTYHDLLCEPRLYFPKVDGAKSIKILGADVEVSTLIDDDKVYIK